MKKILLFIVCGLGLLSSVIVKGQTATFSQADTVYYTYNSVSAATILNLITNDTSYNLNLKWKIIASSFPADWYSGTALSICDDATCIPNTSGQLWNGTSGYFDSSLYFSNIAHDSIGDFHMVLNLSSATSFGSYYLTIHVTDVTNGVVGAYSKTSTFIINRWPTSVANVNNTGNDVVIYPNPTSNNEINLLYSPNNDIKTITVYNIIGKVMKVYNVTNNTSANLNLENIPSGIYFVRLINSHGDVVVTRKFTKQ